MRAPLMVSHLLVMLQHASIVTAQPLKPGGDITCTEGQQATGDSSKIGTGTALLGAIACTDPGAVAYRRTLPESVAGPIDSGGTTDGLATVNIYGPFEAGFTNAQPGMSCLGTNAVAGGIDTSTAELVIQHLCSDATLKIIDTCGDHASPRHFHEYLTDCLTSRTTSGGSSRLGTAADGRGIYGKYGPSDTLPTLDACGAINAPTPDSNGASVVHYHAQAGRPFSSGATRTRTRAQRSMSAAPSTPSVATRPRLSPSPRCTAPGSTTNGARASTSPPRATSRRVQPPTTRGRPSWRVPRLRMLILVSPLPPHSRRFLASPLPPRRQMTPISCHRRLAAALGAQAR